jgi:hypothetical protein
MIPGLSAGGGIGGPSAASATTGTVSFGGFTFAPPAKINWMQLGIVAAIAVGAVLLLRK